MNHLVKLTLQGVKVIERDLKKTHVTLTLTSPEWQVGQPRGCLGCLSLPLLPPSKGDHLQCVFDGIGEVLQCADGDGLLRRVLAGAVGLCQERDNHLHVALRTQCTWFQQWFTVVHTAAVHVQAYGKTTGGDNISTGQEDRYSPKQTHVALPWSSSASKLTSIHIVQGIGNTIKVLEEAVIIDVLCVRPNTILMA